MGQVANLPQSSRLSKYGTAWRQYRPRGNGPAGPRTNEPDPVWAAVMAELGGADGVTLHLREDRRHIQERDLRILRQTVTVKLNLEMACDPQVLEIACQVKPDQATLVPEHRRGNHHRGRTGHRCPAGPRRPRHGGVRWRAFP